ncbi:MAG: hypothetical protein AAFQ34_02175 [Pseudomonadota bacterium]
MKLAWFFLPLAALSLTGCEAYEKLFGEDPRLGDEVEEICIGRVRAKLTYEQYQELENAGGRWVPTYTYDISLLNLEAIQDLIAKGADDMAGSRLMQQTNNTKVAIDRFKRMKVDRQGALFLGQRPTLFRVRGATQPASTILASGCQAQLTNTRLIEVSWRRVGAGAAPAPEAPEEAVPELDVDDIPNLGGVR